MSPPLSPLRAANQAIERVGIRIWAADPEMCFVQVKQQFSFANVTNSETKFSYVAQHLEQKYAMELLDVLIAPQKVVK